MEGSEFDITIDRKGSDESKARRCSRRRAAVAGKEAVWP